MSRPEDDAEASTMAIGGGGAEMTLADRSSRPAIGQPGKGSMVGRYRLEARLGAGAMGVVWSARDPELDRDVAIKLVHAALHSDESASRFRREARAMAKLSHRSVITVHDTGVVDGQLFLAMELVRGTTLGQLLRDRDAAAIADWPRWLAMLLDAGRGLAEAHRNGVLHRDFKPDNVLVDKAGRVCVGDFGLASLGDRGTPRPSSPAVGPVALGNSVAFDLTTTGAVLGTPLYMSPQQLNAEAIDERADQFAFCVALHEAMYGHRPYSSDAQGLAAIPSLIEKIAGGVPEPSDTTVPRKIHDCIVRGLAFEPDQRWPDMDTLITALERAGRRRGTTTMKPPGVSRPVWFGVAGAVLAAAGVAAFVISRAPRSELTPPSAPLVVTPPTPQKAELTLLFNTPLNTRTAISPEGRTIALTGDQLEVRDLDTHGKPSEPINILKVTHPLIYLEVDNHEVRYATELDGLRWRWRYRETNVPVSYGPLDGFWRGSTLAGELVRPRKERGLALVTPSGALERWEPANVDILAISPDRRRVAYVDGGRFKGTIRIRDVTTGEEITSPEIDEPMALAWMSPTTLLYASSTMVDPTIFRTEVGATFGKPEVFYTQTRGWFSDLVVGGGNVYVVSMSPTPRGRIIEPDAGRRNRELDSVSLAVGWDAADRMVTWNKANQKLSSHAGRLDSEPANATRVGDTLIAAIRVLGGRRGVAVSLTTGKPVWQHDDKRTIAVRCAGDHAPPCFAIRYVDENVDQVVTLDPATGALGTDVIYEHRRIEDLAVRPDGQALLVTEGAGLREIRPDGSLVAYHALVDGNGKQRLNIVRSVAYTPDGYLVAGTVGRNAYQVGRMKGDMYEALDDAYDKILMLVRPSSDGKSIVSIARGYEPQLYRLPVR